MLNSNQTQACPYGQEANVTMPRIPSLSWLVQTPFPSILYSVLNYSEQMMEVCRNYLNLQDTLVRNIKLS